MAGLTPRPAIPARQKGPTVIINATVSRITEDGRHVDIPFFIDSVSGTYSQWGHDMFTLGESVDLLGALRAAMLNTD